MAPILLSELAKSSATRNHSVSGASGHFAAAAFKQVLITDRAGRAPSSDAGTPTATNSACASAVIDGRPEIVSIQGILGTTPLKTGVEKHPNLSYFEETTYQWPRSPSFGAVRDGFLNGSGFRGEKERGPPNPGMEMAPDFRGQAGDTGGAPLQCVAARKLERMPKGRGWADASETAYEAERDSLGCREGSIGAPCHTCHPHLHRENTQ